MKNKKKGEPIAFEEKPINTTRRKVMKTISICIKDNHTWDIVPKSENVRPISCQWVDKVKICLHGLSKSTRRC